MYVESSTLLWADLIVTGILGTIATPFIIYFLSQNTDRKKETAAAFKSVNDQRDVDRTHFDTALGELRDRTTKLQTTVDIKRELVDKVQATQISDGLRLATLEANVSTIKESQKRTEEVQTQIMSKLEPLGRIEEAVEGLKDDVRELRNRKSE